MSLYSACLRVWVLILFMRGYRGGIFLPSPSHFLPSSSPFLLPSPFLHPFFNPSPSPFLPFSSPSPLSLFPTSLPFLPPSRIPCTPSFMAWNEAMISFRCPRTISFLFKSPVSTNVTPNNVKPSAISLFMASALILHSAAHACRFRLYFSVWFVFRQCYRILFLESSSWNRLKFQSYNTEHFVASSGNHSRSS